MAERQDMKMISRCKMYSLRRLRTKPALKVEPHLEYKPSYISNAFCGHEFTDDELALLEYGDAVKIECVSKAGKAFRCEVMLKERAGKYVWVPSFADDFGRTKEEWKRSLRSDLCSYPDIGCTFKTKDCPIYCEVMECEGYKDRGYWQASDAHEKYYTCPGEHSKECPHYQQFKQARDKEQAWLDKFLAARVVI